MYVNDVASTLTYGTTFASAASTNAASDKDRFLKLLMVQLQNQNPMSPLESQDYTAQLAQFSQLEQLSEIRSLMEEQIQTNLVLTQNIANSALPGLLGKNAKASSDKINFDGENPVSLGYFLPYQAAEANVTVKDSNGNTVKEFSLSSDELLYGNHTVKWDGTDDSGAVLSKGKYTFEVTASDASGTSFGADTYSFGTIEACRFTSNGTVIVINGLEYSLSDITDISTN